MRSSISQLFVLLFFFLLSLFLLNFFNFHFYHIKGIKYPASISSILIDIISTKYPPRPFTVILNKVNKCKDNPDTKKKSNQDSSS